MRRRRPPGRLCRATSPRRTRGEARQAISGEARQAISGEGARPSLADDPDLSFPVRDGRVTLADRRTGRTHDLKVLRQDRGAGEHELEATDADPGLSFKARTFSVRRGERVALQAVLERKERPVAKRGVDDAWVKQVDALPAARQVKAVADKLAELNTGFDGRVTPRLEGVVVTELHFSTDRVTDISPVRVFSHLRVLDCQGSFNQVTWSDGKGQLADLSPLREMNLADLMSLQLSWTKVRDEDLAVLEDCKNLTLLWLGGTNVTDAGLDHLRNCKRLRALNLENTKVGDAGLALLRNWKDLSDLWLRSTPVTDEGMAHLASCKNLMALDLFNTGVGNAGLACLKECKGLTHLNLEGTQVSDLSPLKGLRLTGLWCDGSKVTDLSPLKGVPLQDLRCDFKAERDSEILRSIPTLGTINGKPAGEFLGKKP